MNSFIPFIDLCVVLNMKSFVSLAVFFFFSYWNHSCNNSNQNHSSSVLISFYIGFKYYSVFYIVVFPGLDISGHFWNCRWVQQCLLPCQVAPDLCSHPTQVVLAHSLYKWVPKYSEHKWISKEITCFYYRVSFLFALAEKVLSPVNSPSAHIRFSPRYCQCNNAQAWGQFMLTTWCTRNCSK